MERSEAKGLGEEAGPGLQPARPARSITAAVAEHRARDPRFGLLIGHPLPTRCQTTTGSAERLPEHEFGFVLDGWSHELVTIDRTAGHSFDLIGFFD